MFLLEKLFFLPLTKTIVSPQETKVRLRVFLHLSLLAIHVFKIKTPKPESSYFIQKSMTRDPDRQIKCSLRIVPLGHRLGFIADNLTPYTLSLSPFGLLFYEMHLFIFPKSKLQNLSQVILFRSQ